MVSAAEKCFLPGEAGLRACECITRRQVLRLLRLSDSLRFVSCKRIEIDIDQYSSCGWLEAALTNCRRMLGGYVSALSEARFHKSVKLGEVLCARSIEP